MAEVIMPKMGDAMTEGKILRWMKRAGDKVTAGEAIAEIETDKVNVELTAEETGTLVEVLANDGESVPVGKAIAIIGGPQDPVRKQPQSREASSIPAGEAPPRSTQPAQSPLVPAAAEGRPTGEPRTPERVPPEERIKASPLARRLAQEHGVDLAAIQGTGPEGRITKEDVEEFAARRRDKGRPEVPGVSVPSRPATTMPSTSPAAPTPSAAPAQPSMPSASMPSAPPTVSPPPARGLRSEEVPLSRMRQTIARRMSESKQAAPHFYITSQILMDEALSVRRQLNEGLGEKLISVNDLVLRAAALALHAFPNLNATLAGEVIRRHGEVHMGFALAVPEGLIVPVIRNCDRKSLIEIAREAKDLGDRAHSGRLHPDQLQGATFTVSNLGMFDVESFIAIINPPQAAILAVGSAVLSAIVEDEQVKVAHVMKATVSADHRVTDGAEVARYLIEFKRLLQNPVLLAVNLP